MALAASVTDVEPNLYWRTQRFVDRTTGRSAEAIRIVQQLTTDFGEFVVLAVRTTDERYWAVSDPSGFGLYRRSEYDRANGALSAHLDAVRGG
ncbi:hypothetical protein [Halomarina oriensis]|uniref:Uncharacterized protein n=1 Tax=Halomarina oriensis TaxID=671145 RepID=A0A6B0GI60_9EURY|nr:hypothetical protein [Halomarina oriensis]MWG34552.1 hypothetical protein [Halomarina oriensis]